MEAGFTCRKIFEEDSRAEPRGRGEESSPARFPSCSLSQRLSASAPQREFLHDPSSLRLSVSTRDPGLIASREEELG